jgi:hypothetical protein
MIAWFEIEKEPPKINKKTGMTSQLLYSDGRLVEVGFLRITSDGKFEGMGEKFGSSLEIKAKFWAEISLPFKNRVDYASREELEQKLFVHFTPAGECVVNLTVLQKLWNSDWCIQQSQTLFKIVQILNGSQLVQAVISKEQAGKIIDMLHLKEEPVLNDTLWK